MAHDDNGREWHAYYDQFPYFSSELIREGSCPRLFEHGGDVDKAIVLVHGLTDSPYFMLDLARRFYSQFNYNVYVPLLQCHALKDPKGMEGVDLREWKRNVRFAIEVASQRAKNVSIGGLSTGGTLSFLMAAKDERINDSLFLFSAALDLAGGIWGQVKEKILRTPVAKIMDKNDRKRPLIGENPYRYARMDKGGARQLSLLIKEVDRFLNKNKSAPIFSRPAFAAHSESDTTTAISGITKLVDYFEPGHFTFHRIPQSKRVSHASLVLEKPIYAKGASPDDMPLEEANAFFEDLVGAIAQFLTTNHYSESG